jgi:hypothetical protein
MSVHDGIRFLEELADVCKVCGLELHYGARVVDTSLRRFNALSRRVLVFIQTMFPFFRNIPSTDMSIQQECVSSRTRSWSEKQRHTHLSHGGHDVIDETRDSQRYPGSTVERTRTHQQFEGDAYYRTTISIAQVLLR